MTLMLPLAAAQRDSLHFRIKRLAANRPGTYRMLNSAGKVIYVGKAKALRTRLLSYFRARYPADKAARILNDAADIQYDYTHSEFAAALAELHLIRKYRPPWNVQMNRGRRQAYLVLTNEPFPRLLATTNSDHSSGRRYGPLPSPERAREAVRVLGDLLQLRDCRLDLTRSQARQGDLFAAPPASSPDNRPAAAAACPRWDFGTCLAPCFQPCEADYAHQVEEAAAFCEGRSVAPMARLITAMNQAADAGDYAGAIRWREKFEALEWLLSVTTRARNSTALLSFIYHDPGSHGDDRVYLIRNGEIRACYPDPITPLEREAFAAVVQEERQCPVEPSAAVSLETWHERLLLISWFRNHPESWRRTEALF